MSVIRLYIESVSVSATQVFPDWSGILDSEREEGQIFFRDKISGELRFTKTEYTLIKDVPDCERIEVYMEEYCEAAWIERWRGYFTTYDVKFNESKCIATVTPKIMDVYECFTGKLKDKNDTAYYATTRIVSSLGELYQIAGCCIDTIAITDPTPTTAVCAVPANYCFDHNTRDDYPDTAESIITSCFHRIVADGVSGVVPPPFGTGWTLLSGIQWWRCPDTSENTLGALKYGRLFKDVLTRFADIGCGFTVRSHFFGLNDTHTAPPSNDAYTFANDYLQTLMIHQKSDVKRPTATNQASVLVWNMTWEDILNDLRTMFNVYWYMPDASTLILEHLSYFSSTAGLDLSASNIVIDYGKREDAAPNKETFHWADDAKFTAEHAGLPILYGECGTGTKERRVKLFSNDLYYIKGTENQAEVSDTGFCLVSTFLYNSKYYVQEYNEPLGWERLHDKLHRHGRFFVDGTMNGAPETFLSTVKTRDMESFKVNQCCFDAFDPSNYITTAAGQIEVKRVQRDYFSGKENNVLTIEAAI